VVALVAAFGFGIEAVAISSPFRSFWSPTFAQLVASSASRAALFGLAWLAFFAWCLRALRITRPT
jgi:hypothetical protein